MCRKNDKITFQTCFPSSATEDSYFYFLFYEHDPKQGGGRGGKTTESRFWRMPAAVFTFSFFDGCLRPFSLFSFFDECLRLLCFFSQSRPNINLTKRPRKIAKVRFWAEMVIGNQRKTPLVIRMSWSNRYLDDFWKKWKRPQASIKKWEKWKRPQASVKKWKKWKPLQASVKNQK